MLDDWFRVLTLSLDDTNLPVLALGNLNMKSELASKVCELFVSQSIAKVVVSGNATEDTLQNSHGAFTGVDVLEASHDSRIKETAADGDIQVGKATANDVKTSNLGITENTENGNLLSVFDQTTLAEQRLIHLLLRVFLRLVLPLAVRISRFLVFPSQVEVARYKFKRIPLT